MLPSVLKEAVAPVLRWMTENAHGAPKQPDALSTEDNVERLNKVSAESQVLGRRQQAPLPASSKVLAQTRWDVESVLGTVTDDLNLNHFLQPLEMERGRNEGV